MRCLPDSRSRVLPEGRTCESEGFPNLEDDNLVYFSTIRTIPHHSSFSKFACFSGQRCKLCSIILSRIQDSPHFKHPCPNVDSRIQLTMMRQSYHLLGILYRNSAAIMVPVYSTVLKTDHGMAFPRISFILLDIGHNLDCRKQVPLAIFKTHRLTLRYIKQQLLSRAELPSLLRPLLCHRTLHEVARSYI